MTIKEKMQSIFNDRNILTNHLKKFFELPLHPYLLVIYFSLVFISNDLATGFPLEVIYLPMGFLLILVSIILGLGYFLKKDIHKIACLISVLFVMNYVFDPVRDIFGQFVRRWTIPGMSLDFSTYEEQTVYLFAIWTLLIIVICYVLYTRNIESTVSQIFNFVCIILLIQVIASVSLILFTHEPEELKSEAYEIASVDNPIFASMNVTTPLNDRDFYFLIIDRYPGKETLQEFYGFDNSHFINNLTSLGFTVIDNSSSNTGYTISFTPIVMNLNYSYNSYEMGYYNRQNSFHLTDFFKRNGFTIYGAYSEYRPLYHIQESQMVIDIPLNKKTSISRSTLPDVIVHEIPLFVVSEYLTNSYVGRIVLLMDYRLQKTTIIDSLIQSNVLTAYKNWIVTLYSDEGDVSESVGNEGDVFESVSEDELFNRVRDVSLDQNKTFTYVHFGGTGQITQGSVGVNHKIEETVRVILDNSEIPPVIVILSDHGIYPTSTSNTNWRNDVAPHKHFVEQWGCYFEEGATRPSTIDSNYMVNNFQAYYLPDGGNAVLYDTITPVNSWRMILNYYFDGSLPRLADISYWYGIDGWFKVRENGSAINCINVKAPAPLNE
jgi:hypothetical protein